MSEAAATRRIPALDIARGVALLAMVIYHAGWDLSFLGLAATGLRDNAAWQLFGHAIAASFLTLVGLALRLAHGGGIRRAAFLKRLGMVAAAAAVVTGATFYAFPNAFIYFGILHAIALGSVLALPFLNAPLVVLVLAAGTTFVLPLLISSAALSSPWLVWLGLGSAVPPSNDFVPIFPWFGFILLGVLLARVYDFSRYAAPEPARQPAKLASLAGRHSLAVYLVHQPLIYGAFWLIAQAASPAVDKETQEFLTSCTGECTSNGGELKICVKICSCAADSLKAEKLWSEATAARLPPELQERFVKISLACAEKAKAAKP